MEASRAVPADRTAGRGRQPEREALLALQGAESAARTRLAAGQAAVREGRVVAAAEARPVAVGRPPRSRVRGDVAGWERGAVS